MGTNQNGSGWQRQLGRRLLAHWRLKPFVIPGSMTAFFIGYFALLHVNLFAVTEMPITALDRLIGFSASSLWLYGSLWAYVTLVPALLDTRRDLLVYYLSATAICLVAFPIYLFWPTVSPPANIDWARYPMYESLKAVDQSGNAFPSLHACFAIFSGIWLDRLLRQLRAHASLRLINLAWCLGILYSTLATKQHVAVDLFAGAALGIAGAGLHLKIEQFAQRFVDLAVVVPAKSEA